MLKSEMKTGEKNISDMAIEYAPASKLYNAEMAELLGVTIPEGYQPLE